ncbi:hypothetical protein ACQP2X_49025 [Actinoplanes sp. CA-131856]
MSRSRWLTCVGLTMLSTVTANALATPARAAEAETANVVVALTADRNILPTSGWSSPEVVVRNDGTLPAAGVTVSLTLPPELRVSGSESTSNWDCDWAIPTMTCAYLGELAPGQSERAIVRSVGVEGARPGAVLPVVATASTTTPESSTADNTASRQIRIVDSGDITGRLWNDLNADGVRQANEPPATDVGISIRSQDDEDSYGFANNYNGTYRETVPSKRFTISTHLYRFNWLFTKPNVGNDATDSDLTRTGGDQYDEIGETPVFTVSPSTPTVVDLGVVAAFRPTRIAPASALQGSTAVVTLTGQSFTSSLEVKLTRPGSEPITGVLSTVAADRTSMTVSFPLAQAAPGAWTLTLDRMYGPHAEVANAFTVTLPPVRATAAPAISGTVAVGSTVKASTGTWTPAPARYAYQWLANGVAIGGATGSSLVIPAAALGKRLTVRVTASRDGNGAGVATSAASVAVAKGRAPVATKKPAIAGTVKVGYTVKAAVGTWSPLANRYAYQWLANGAAIRGATGPSLAISGGLAGKRLTVKVTAARDGHLPGAAVSAASAAVAKGNAPKATKKPVVTGTAKVGRTVRAATGSWSPKPDAYRYEWRLNGKLISGATSATLKLTAFMKNKKLTVTVVARKTGYTDGRAMSATVTVRK